LENYFIAYILSVMSLWLGTFTVEKKITRDKIYPCQSGNWIQKLAV